MGQEDWEGYMGLARQADKSATQARSQSIRDAWRGIAEEYRALAAMALERSKRGTPPQSPS